MSFIKKIFRKDPREELQKEIDLLKKPDKAINYFELFSIYDKALVEELISKKFKGRFIGKKGWFLPNWEKQSSELWEKMKHKPIDLNEISDSWGLNKKRIEIALNLYLKENKIKNSEIIRHKDLLISNVYLDQAWEDALATADLEENLYFDKILAETRINSEYRELLKTRVLEIFSDGKYSYALGEDGIIRLKSDIPELLPETISEIWKLGASEISYEDLATRFGLQLEEITSIINELTDKLELKDTTNYPMDEILKPRNI